MNEDIANYIAANLEQHGYRVVVQNEGSCYLEVYEKGNNVPVFTINDAD